MSIQADEAGIRLDRYLTFVLTGFSRTTIQQLIVGGEVLVNGHTGKSGYTLRIGDEVQVMSLNMLGKAT
ncbi:MAG TPA: S4 domain-containing protein, partial [Ktedonobacteraceae bacterium]|nr:S4 domain-containing protein [Ktedonobacteraceae bacterium]